MKTSNSKKSFFSRLTKLQKALLILGAVLVLLLVVSAIYFCTYYSAEQVAVDILQQENVIEVDNLTFVLADSENATGDAMIFYPGAKVEAIAYLPLLDRLASEGISCVLVEMPFNHAFFDVDGAEDVFELVDLLASSSAGLESHETEKLSVLCDVENWYISGHSLGGAMASSYASNNQDKVSGLILMGAYVYGEYPLENSLTIYGTLNNGYEEKLYYDVNVVLIEGGNHANFGNYGSQLGDNEAEISASEQQKQTAEAIVEFMGS